MGFCLRTARSSLTNLFFLALIAACCGTASAGKYLTDRPGFHSVIAGLEREVPGLLKRNRVPGAAVALVDDRGLVWAGGFGFTNRSAKRRVTADTLFSLQSVTKTYT